MKRRSLILTLALLLTAGLPASPVHASESAQGADATLRIIDNYELLVTDVDRCHELSRAGTTLHRQGRYSEALEAYQNALTCYGEAGDRAGEGTTLNNIGLVYESQGRYQKALAVLQQAMVIHSEVGDRAAQGTTLTNIGLVYDAQGRYGEALDYYHQALEFHRQAGNRAHEGTTLNNIGVIYGQQGRHAEALEVLQQALVIHRQLGARAIEGTTLDNIGLAYDGQGRYEEALDAYQQALTVQREVGDRAGEALSLVNIGSVHHIQERYGEALDCYQAALAIHRELGDLTNEGRALGNIGVIYEHQGRYGEAVDCHQQAVAILTQLGHRPGEAASLYNLGFAYQQQGRLDQALAYYEQAMTVFESLRSVAGSEAGRAGFIAQHAGLYDEAVKLYHQQGQDIEAFYTSERARARAFLDSLATGHVELTDETCAALYDREREAYAARQAAQDALARAPVKETSDPSLVADLEAQLTQAEDEHAAALAAIEARGERLAALVPGRSTVLTLSEVQALLDDRTTLVSYYVLGAEGTLAFVVSRDSATVVELPEATPARLRTSLVDLYKWLSRENPHPLPLRNLHRCLVAPLIDHLDTPLVGVIPHRVLHYVPFAALTDGRTYFGQRYTLFTLPSVTALRFIQDNASGARGSSALVFGNPETGDPGLPSLAHAAAEAEAVAGLLGTRVRTGPEASEECLCRDVSDARVVHLAAHGAYNPDAPLYSTIHLAPAGERDGRLEVQEVYGLDLAAELVVLSACQSNVEELTAGDEVVGLTRAFFFAGASTVVASLWQVDDAATEQLMVAFYRHQADGMRKGAALRAAQAEVRETHPSPFYWAGFVLSGDPGTMARASRSQPSVCPLSLALPLALALTAWGKRRGS